MSAPRAGDIIGHRDRPGAGRLGIVKQVRLSGQVEVLCLVTDEHGEKAKVFLWDPDVVVVLERPGEVRQ